MEAVIVDQNTNAQRRTFTQAEKLAILVEAKSDGNTVSGVAKKHGASASQVFAWKKISAKEGQHTETVNNDASSGELVEYRKMLSEIKEQERLLAVVSTRVKTEALSGKGNSYNLSNSLSSLATSLCKLQDRKEHLLERIGMLEQEEAAAAAKRKELPIDFAIQVEAERMCYELVRKRVENKKAEAQRAQALQPSRNAVHLRTSFLPGDDGNELSRRAAPPTID